MVAFTVEPFGGTFCAVVVLYGFSAPRPIIMQDRPGTAAFVRRLQVPMKMLPTIKILVLTPHQTVQHVARRMTVGMLVPHAPKSRLRTQVQHHIAQMMSDEWSASPKY